MGLTNVTNWAYEEIKKHPNWPAIGLVAIEEAEKRGERTVFSDGPRSLKYNLALVYHSIAGTGIGVLIGMGGAHTLVKIIENYSK